MLTVYQTIIKAHLIILFERGDLVTPVLVVQSSEREFIIALSVQCGYTPVFSDDHDGWVQFSGIKTLLPC